MERDRRTIAPLAHASDALRKPVSRTLQALRAMIEAPRASFTGAHDAVDQTQFEARQLVLRLLQPCARRLLGEAVA